MLDALAKAGVAFVALKENIRVEGKRDIQTKVMTTLFALFAEVERDLISERTREGLAKARASGRKLGRPKGSLGVSRLDGKEDEIRRFLELGVSKTAIAKLTGVSRTALYAGGMPFAWRVRVHGPGVGLQRAGWVEEALGLARGGAATDSGGTPFGRLRPWRCSSLTIRRSPRWRPFSSASSRRRFPGSPARRRSPR